MPGTDPKGLRVFHNELARKLGKMGLTGKETIVVYESRFGMRAARVAWMLEYAGAPQVYLLEGGFQGWKESGYAVDERILKRAPENFRFRPMATHLATADDLRSKLSWRILDVRSEGEFAGTDGRECDRRLGRIPRATWLEWTSFVKDGERFKTRTEVDASLKERGIKRSRPVVTYCHRGARAAAAFYALRSLGYRNVKNYIGSWHEWSSRRSLSVVR